MKSLVGESDVEVFVRYNLRAGSWPALWGWGWARSREQGPADGSHVPRGAFSTCRLTRRGQRGCRAVPVTTLLPGSSLSFFCVLLLVEYFLHAQDCCSSLSCRFVWFLPRLPSNSTAEGQQGAGTGHGSRVWVWGRLGRVLLAPAPMREGASGSAPDHQGTYGVTLPHVPQAG